MVLPEVADLLHDRISRFPQVFFVAAESVVFPQMLRIPGAAGAIPLPKRDPASVIHRPHRPAADITVMHPRDLGADFANTIHIVNKRNMALGDVGSFHRPVVHLEVNVGVVVTRPDGQIAVIPHALQVGRKSARTGARD